MKSIIKAIPLFLLILILNRCGLFETPGEDNKNETKLPVPVTREDAIRLYNESFNDFSSYTWNGALSTCNPGSLTPDVLSKVLRRVNFYRKTVGLKEVVFSTPANSNAQQAALMMYSNNELNHNPPSTWKCFTSEGAGAASKGNLIARSILNPVNETFIDRWIEDSGSNNIAVRHRRLIFLDSENVIFGFGSTGYTACLTLDVTNFSQSTQNLLTYIAYPPSGHIVSGLVYPRWSFMVNYGDVTAAVVKMTDSKGNGIAVNKLSHDMMEKTLVWEPELTSSVTQDTRVTVEISGVRLNNESKTFTYDVTIVKM